MIVKIISKHILKSDERRKFVRELVFNVPPNVLRASVLKGEQELL